MRILSRLTFMMSLGTWMFRDWNGASVTSALCDPSKGCRLLCVYCFWHGLKLRWQQWEACSNFVICFCGFWRKTNVYQGPSKEATFVDQREGFLFVLQCTVPIIEVLSHFQPFYTFAVPYCIQDARLGHWGIWRENSPVQRSFASRNRSALMGASTLEARM